MSSAPAPAAAPPVARGAWLALAVVLGAAFMSLLDTTIVNVALPTIRTSVDASESTLSWIISGYALAFGLALLATDLHGGPQFTRRGGSCPRVCRWHLANLRAHRRRCR